MAMFRYESMRGAEQDTIVHEPANPDSAITTVLPPDDPRKKIAFEVGQTLVLHFAADERPALVVGAPLAAELSPATLYKPPEALAS